eukprot:6909366-Pyramimonas_sp.AAC.2
MYDRSGAFWGVECIFAIFGTGGPVKVILEAGPKARAAVAGWEHLTSRPPLTGHFLTHLALAGRQMEPRALVVVRGVK